MGKIDSNYEFEKLVVGLMYNDVNCFYSVLKELIKSFGNIDTISEEYTFSDFSDFYDIEMNGTVQRRFVSFEQLVNPQKLSEIKIHTNSIEDKYYNCNGRNINIDPSILGHGKFIMATTKNASFRIPLNNGIYADLSLIYYNHSWHDFYWTYFDIKSDIVKEYLLEVRKVYMRQRKTII